VLKVSLKPITRRFYAPVALVGVMATVFPTVSRADDVQACIEAHEHAQVARKEGKLLDARQSLLTCVRDTCPTILQKECAPWLTEVNSSIPTISVIARRADGTELYEVRVLVDGRQVASTLDGRAIEVDPGPHVLRFETDGLPPVEQETVFREGIKNHEVMVVFESTSSGPPAPLEPTPDVDRDTIRPVPTMVYVLGGVGIAGLATSVYFEARGLSKRSDLDAQGCKPFCSTSDVDAAKRDILIGDIALGAGLVSLGAATYFYLSRPSVPTSTASVQPSLDLRKHTAMAFVQGSF
jgi:hypothetical protein